MSSSEKKINARKTKEAVMHVWKKKLTQRDRCPALSTSVVLLVQTDLRTDAEFILGLMADL